MYRMDHGRIMESYDWMLVGTRTLFGHTSLSHGIAALLLAEQLRTQCQGPHHHSCDCPIIPCVIQNAPYYWETTVFDLMVYHLPLPVLSRDKGNGDRGICAYVSTQKPAK